MASYRRSYRSRRNVRRTGSYKKRRVTTRRSYGGRRKTWSLGRKRRAPYRARRFKRRVLAISQTKKSDKMLGASGAGNIQSIVLPTTGGGVSYNLWSPPTREYDSVSDNPQDRNSADIFFVGWKDVLYVEMSQALVWRRVIFWSYERYEFAQTVLTTAGTYYRRWEPYQNSFHPEVTEEVLRGTEGVDYDERWAFDAAIDRKKVRVIYDKKLVFNPQANNPTVRNFKRWHPIRRKIVFDNPEAGDMLEQGVWSVESPNSAGNLYVWDMFAHALSTGPTAGPTSIRTESTVYWRETS